MPLQNLLPAALLLHILLSGAVASAFVGPAGVPCCAHRARTIISTGSARRHASSSSSGAGDDRASSTEGSTDEWDLESSKGRSKRDVATFSGRYVNDNGLQIVTEKDGRVTARPAADSVSPSGGSKRKSEKRGEEGVSSLNEDDDIAPAKVELVESISTLKPLKKVGVTSEEDTEASASEGKRRIVIRGNKPKPIVPKKQLKEHPVQTSIPTGGFNVVLTHCTADFDSLASAVGLAKLWSSEGSPADGKAPASENDSKDAAQEDDAYNSSSTVPTFVVLPRGAHPGVQKFLALHKHLFPIRSLKSLPSDLSNLNRLGLVDAQRRDRLGPAEPLLGHADRVTIVDHVSILCVGPKFASNAFLIGTAFCLLTRFHIHHLKAY